MAFKVYRINDCYMLVNAGGGGQQIQSKLTHLSTNAALFEIWQHIEADIERGSVGMKWGNALFEVVRIAYQEGLMK